MSFILNTQQAITTAQQSYNITVSGWDSSTGLAPNPVPYYGVKAQISNPIALPSTTGASASSTYFSAVPISGGRLVQTNSAYNQTKVDMHIYQIVLLTMLLYSLI